MPAPQNMPKDNIERAIKKAPAAMPRATRRSATKATGPGGVAMIVEALTDNRNRTAGAVRSYFTKYGGALGETGSVAFMFDRVGEIVYPATAGTADKVLEAAIEAGADDVESDEDGHVVTAPSTDLGEVAQEPRGGARRGRDGEGGVAAADHRRRSTRRRPQTLMKLIAALEDDDDVQAVYSNFEVSDEVMGRLTAA